MVRQGRLHVPYATYYVVNRFPPDLELLVPAAGDHDDSRALLRIHDSRRRFEELLDYVCRRWCARVHAYCWLPDSVLLLVQIARMPLENILRSLLASYSHVLHDPPGTLTLRHGDDANEGAVSRSLRGAERYHALLIDPEEFFLDFVRHIYWCPVKAGLCPTPLAYEYSSARAALGAPAPRFLYRSGVVKALAARGSASRTAFFTYLHTEPSKRFAGILAHGSRDDPRIAGGGLFVQEMRLRAQKSSPRVAPETIVAWVGARLGIAPDDIIHRPWHHMTVQARALAAWLATCLRSASLREIAQYFSCSPSTLHRAIRSYLRLRPDLFSYAVLQELEQVAEQTGNGGGTSEDFGEPSDSDENDGLLRGREE